MINNEQNVARTRGFSSHNQNANSIERNNVI